MDQSLSDWFSLVWRILLVWFGLVDDAFSVVWLMVTDGGPYVRFGGRFWRRQLLVREGGRAPRLQLVAKACSSWFQTNSPSFPSKLGLCSLWKKRIGSKVWMRLISYNQTFLPQPWSLEDVILNLILNPASTTNSAPSPTLVTSNSTFSFDPPFQILGSKTDELPTCSEHFLDYCFAI